MAIIEDWGALAISLGYDSEKHMLETLYDEFTLSQIVKIIGSTTYTIRRRLIEHGIKLRPRGGPNHKGKGKLTTVSDDMILHTFPKDVAEQYNVALSTVYNERRRRKETWKQSELVKS